GLVEIDRVHIRALNEGIDADGLVALRYRLGDLLRLQDHVFATVHFIALHLLISLDRLLGFLVDVLTVHAVTGTSIEDVEGDAPRRRRAGIEGDRKRQLSHLHIPLPRGTWRHPKHSPR